MFLSVHLFLWHLVIQSPRTTQPVYKNASTHVVQRETVQNCATLLLSAIGVSKIRIIFYYRSLTAQALSAALEEKNCPSLVSLTVWFSISSVKHFCSGQRATTAELKHPSGCKLTLILRLDIPIPQSTPKTGRKTLKSPIIDNINDNRRPIAQLVENRLTVREIVGSNPDRINTQGL